MISQRHLLFHWKRPRSPGLRSNFHWPRVFWCIHILWLPSNHRLSRWRHQALLSSYYSVGRLGWLAVLSASPGQNQGVPWPSAGLEDLGKKSLPGSFMLLAIQLPVALIWGPHFLTVMGQGVLSASWRLSAFLLVPLQLQGQQCLILLNLSWLPLLPPALDSPPLLGLERIDQTQRLECPTLKVNCVIWQHGISMFS